jgi:hypothetical protein
MAVKGIRTAAIASGLLAAGALAASVVSTEAQQPGPPTGTLQLMQRDRDTTFRFIDVPPRQGERRAPTPGDGALITGAVRDQAGNRAGRLQATFVITNVRREEAEVSATFLLPDGRIMGSGADTKARVDDFAVTGGTGRYAGARGTVTVTEHRRSTTFVFNFMG